MVLVVIALATALAVPVALLEVAFTPMAAMIAATLPTVMPWRASARRAATAAVAVTGCDMVVRLFKNVLSVLGLVIIPLLSLSLAWGLTNR